MGTVRPRVSPTPGWSSEGQVVATRIYRVSMGDVRFLWGSILLRHGALWAQSGPKSNPKEATRPPEGDQLYHNTFIWIVARPWTPAPTMLTGHPGGGPNCCFGFCASQYQFASFPGMVMNFGALVVMRFGARVVMKFGARVVMKFGVLVMNFRLWV